MCGRGALPNTAKSRGCAHTTSPAVSSANRLSFDVLARSSRSNSTRSVDIPSIPLSFRLRPVIQLQVHIPPKRAPTSRGVSAPHFLTSGSSHARRDALYRGSAFANFPGATDDHHLRCPCREAHRSRGSEAEGPPPNRAPRVGGLREVRRPPREASRPQGLVARALRRAPAQSLP